RGLLSGLAGLALSSGETGRGGDSGLAIGNRPERRNFYAVLARGLLLLGRAAAATATACSARASPAATATSSAPAPEARIRLRIDDQAIDEQIDRVGHDYDRVQRGIIECVSRALDQRER